MEKKDFGFQTRSDTNQPVLSQKKSRIFEYKKKRDLTIKKAKTKELLSALLYPHMLKAIFLVTWLIYRQSDSSLTRLSQQHFDTGMGLERMCALLQGTMSNYNTNMCTN